LRVSCLFKNQNFIYTLTKNLTETNETLLNYLENNNIVYFNSLKTRPRWNNVKTKPNLIVSCLLCEERFGVKYNALKKQYSQKNNWNYWIGKPKAKYICDTCLMRLHYGSSMSAWITDKNKADNFYSYVYQGVFKK